MIFGALQALLLLMTTIGYLKQCTDESFLQTAPKSPVTIDSCSISLTGNRTGMVGRSTDLITAPHLRIFDQCAGLVMALHRVQ